jgi:hypothetical protein
MDDRPELFQGLEPDQPRSNLGSVMSGAGRNKFEHFRRGALIAMLHAANKGLQAPDFVVDRRASDTKATPD